MIRRSLVLWLLGLFVLFGCSAVNATAEQCGGRAPEWHCDVIATVFWVGEEPTEQNGYVGNDSSAWTLRWTEAFGGVDDPHDRDGMFPAGFEPRENPFYVALPYNDLTSTGHHREDVPHMVPWADEAELQRGRSILKNRWIEITRRGARCFGQWEDVGPYLQDDASYVFGADRPKNEVPPFAGIDVSPALRDCLELGAAGRVSWRFAEASEVPDGPWRRIVTVSETSFR